VSEPRPTGIGARARVAPAGELREIGVGMLGYVFMGKVHWSAFRTNAI
jgi:hypothetical protein